MRLLRVVAALAAIVTTLLVQATVVSPVALPLPVSLGAVLVAAIAMIDGPGVGIAFGFVAGLLADLGSTHPAGVLALAWTAIGVACGTAASGRSIRRDAVTAGLVCGSATLAAGLLLTLLGAGGATAWPAIRDAAPAAIFDAVLALGIIPVARTLLRSEALRAPAPEFIELSTAGRG